MINRQLKGTTFQTVVDENNQLVNLFRFKVENLVVDLN